MADTSAKLWPEITDHREQYMLSVETKKPDSRKAWFLLYAQDLCDSGGKSKVASDSGLAGD